MREPWLHFTDRFSSRSYSARRWLIKAREWLAGHNVTEAQRHLFGVVVLCLLVIGAGLGMRDPWPADEPRFALIAQQMIDSGNWMFPHRADELYSDKPPLFMWMIAAFEYVTGSMRVAFLLPSLLAAIGTVVLVYDIARRLWNRRVALLAGVALLASVQFALQTKIAQIDALLMFWTTLGLYGVLRHILLGPSWRWYFIGFAAMGLGVLSKLVGFLPAFVLLPYVVARWRDWPGLARFESRWEQWLAGPVVMMGVAGLWIGPMALYATMSGDPGYIEYRDDLLFGQTFGRYLAPGGHLRPVWHYLVAVIPLFWLPVTLALPWLLPAWWRRLRRHDVRQWLLLSYVVFVVSFFSFTAGKQGQYILPALPAFVLAAAPLLPGLLKHARLQLAARSTIFVAAVLLVGAVVFLTVVKPDRLQQLVTDFGVDIRPLLLVLGAVAALWWLLGKKQRGALALVGTLCSIWVLYGFVGYPLLNSVRSERDFMRHVAERLGPQTDLAIVGYREQHLLFADRDVKTFGYRRNPADEEHDALRWLMSHDNAALLVRKEDLADLCIDATRSTDMGYRYPYRWYVAPRDAVSTACMTTAMSNRSGGS